MKILNPKFQIPISVFLFFTIYNSFAQVPGYLGKRFVVSASMSAFPKIYYSEDMIDYFGKKQGSYDNTLNKQFGISVGYIVSRLGIFSLNYEHINGGFQTKAYANFFNNVTTTYRYTGNGYGIEYTKFDDEKGALAPFGNYTRYQLQNIIVETGDSVEFPKGIVSSRINFPVFAIVYGRQAILFDKIYYDIGARLGLVLRHAPYFQGKSDVYSYTIEDKLSVRMRDQQLFNIFLRIGYLF